MSAAPTATRQASRGPVRALPAGADPAGAARAAACLHGDVLVGVKVDAGVLDGEDGVRGLLLLLAAGGSEWWQWWWCESDRARKVWVVTVLGAARSLLATQHAEHQHAGRAVRWEGACRLGAQERLGGCYCTAQAAAATAAWTAVHPPGKPRHSRAAGLGCPQKTACCPSTQEELAVGAEACCDRP